MDRKLSDRFSDDGSIQEILLSKGDPDANGILRLCESSFKVPPPENFSWGETSITILGNNRLAKDFREKSMEMSRQQGCDINMLNIQYGFKLLSQQQLHAVKHSGYTTSLSSTNHFLGDCKFGVLQIRNLDACLYLAQINEFKPPLYIVISKVLLGKMLHVKPLLHYCPISQGPTPTRGYDCHVSSIKASHHASCDDCIINSSVYLYDFDENGKLLKRPRQVLPLAVIELQADFFCQFQVNHSMQNEDLINYLDRPNRENETLIVTSNLTKSGVNVRQDHEANRNTCCFSENLDIPNLWGNSLSYSDKLRIFDNSEDFLLKMDYDCKSNAEALVELKYQDILCGLPTYSDNETDYGETSCSISDILTMDRLCYEDVIGADCYSNVLIDPTKRKFHCLNDRFSMYGNNSKKKQKISNMSFELFDAELDESECFIDVGSLDTITPMEICVRNEYVDDPELLGKGLNSVLDHVSAASCQEVPVRDKQSDLLYQNNGTVGRDCSGNFDKINQSRTSHHTITNVDSLIPIASLQQESGDLESRYSDASSIHCNVFTNTLYHAKNSADYIALNCYDSHYLLIKWLVWYETEIIKCHHSERQEMLIVKHSKLNSDEIGERNLKLCVKTESAVQSQNGNSQFEKEPKIISKKSVHGANFCSIIGARNSSAVDKLITDAMHQNYIESNDEGSVFSENRVINDCPYGIKGVVSDDSNNNCVIHNSVSLIKNPEVSALNHCSTSMREVRTQECAEIKDNQKSYDFVSEANARTRDRGKIIQHGSINMDDNKTNDCNLQGQGNSTDVTLQADCLPSQVNNLTESPVAFSDNVFDKTLHLDTCKSFIGNDKMLGALNEFLENFAHNIPNLNASHSWQSDRCNVKRSMEICENEYERFSPRNDSMEICENEYERFSPRNDSMEICENKYERLSPSNGSLDSSMESIVLKWVESGKIEKEEIRRTKSKCVKLEEDLVKYRVSDFASDLNGVCAQSSNISPNVDQNTCGSPFVFENEACLSPHMLVTSATPSVSGEGSSLQDAVNYVAGFEIATETSIGNREEMQVSQLIKAAESNLAMLRKLHSNEKDPRKSNTTTTLIHDLEETILVGKRQKSYLEKNYDINLPTSLVRNVEHLGNCYSEPVLGEGSRLSFKNKNVGKDVDILNKSGLHNDVRKPKTNARSSAKAFKSKKPGSVEKNRVNRCGVKKNLYRHIFGKNKIHPVLEETDIKNVTSVKKKCSFSLDSTCRKTKEARKVKKHRVDMEVKNIAEHESLVIRNDDLKNGGDQKPLDNFIKEPKVCELALDIENQCSNSDKSSTEPERFQGRTLLKGGVKPRIIPLELLKKYRGKLCDRRISAKSRTSACIITPILETCYWEDTLNDVRALIPVDTKPQKPVFLHLKEVIRVADDPRIGKGRYSTREASQGSNGSECLQSRHNSDVDLIVIKRYSDSDFKQETNFVDADEKTNQMMMMEERVYSAKNTLMDLQKRF